MERRIPPKPARQQVSDEAADRFINKAPDEKAGAAAPAAPAQPASAAAQTDPALPRALRKRKEPVTMTLDPGILAEFDELAATMGLSRAAATGMAMRRMIDEEKKKR